MSALAWRMHSFTERVGMADLEADVPQAIEDRLGDGLAPGGLFVGKQEEQVDIRARRQQAAAVAAGGDHGHALGFGRISGDG